MQLSLAEVAATLGCPPPEVAGLADGYSIDSRTVRPGELFFAIRGEQRDGHDFVLGALGAGAVGAVIARDAYARFATPFRDRLLPVPDPTRALQQLAHAVRRRWGRKVVAITGSAGKTSTKEMVARVLETRLRVLKTEGNLNNHLGVPLSLLRLTPAHDIAVLEMGMNHRGEIARLAQLAEPQVGIFTNVGSVHLGHFASLDEIALAKRELAEALPANGVMVLNRDDARVARFGDGYGGTVAWFGLGTPEGSARGPGVWADDVRLLGEDGSEFTAVSRDESGRQEQARVRLQLLARHNVANAAAALAAGLVFGLRLSAAAEALAAMAPANGRGRVLHRGGATIIDDSYNSNPPALESMINLVAGMPATRRILVAGEMLELGPAAAALHRRVGDLVAQRRIDVLFAVQGEARHILEAARAAGFAGQGEFFEDAESCGQRLAGMLRPGDVVLAKASRGVRLEKALAAIMGPEALAAH